MNTAIIFNERMQFFCLQELRSICFSMVKDDDSARSTYLRRFLVHLHYLIRKLWGRTGDEERKNPSALLLNFSLISVLKKKYINNSIILKNL